MLCEKQKVTSTFKLTESYHTTDRSHLIMHRTIGLTDYYQMD